MRVFVQRISLALWIFVCAGPGHAEEPNDYRLAAGDAIRILVFQNPDFTLETRVSESGVITYPLIGNVRVGGLTISAAEKEVARLLEDGGLIKRPQVTIVLQQVVGNQVAVLGYVNRPGSYPLTTFNVRLSQMLATAGGVSTSGGVAQLGSEKIVLTGMRDGKRVTREIDLGAIYLDGKSEDDVVLSSGDTIYVPKSAMFYIYGEVNHPGALPLERNMTVMQALAAGGGPTQRGTERRIRVHRRTVDGNVERLPIELSDRVRPDDVIYVNESLF